MPLRIALAVALALTLLTVPAPLAAARGSADVAALQAALRATGLYGGAVDGVNGPRTQRAVRRLQRRARLPVDGVAGPRTRAALRRRGRPRLGSRAASVGARGWDVAAIQFLLGWRGFPAGGIDGGFGLRTEIALRRYQRWARLGVDGVAGPRTLRSLRRPPRRSPLALRRPVRGPVGDRFGPRDARFHAGLDFPVPFGRRVRAARGGTVTFAGWHPGGFGLLVSVAHGRGTRTLYAHLSSLAVRRGRRVRTGRTLGRVGATGHATGPHLHFELRLRGAALDPLTGL